MLAPPLPVSPLSEVRSLSRAVRLPVEPQRAERAQPAQELVGALHAALSRSAPAHTTSSAPAARLPRSLRLFDAQGEARAIALIAHGGELSAVARSVQQIETARLVLGPDVGSAVLGPIATGWLGDASYAVFPDVRPLHTSGLRGIADRFDMARRAFRFAYDVARASGARLAPMQRKARVWLPLEHLLRRSDLSAETRALARTTLERVERGSFEPMRVLAHNAFGKRALARPSHARAGDASGYGMFVTDWDAVDADGSPCWDIVRLADSLRLPRFWLARELARHAKLFQLEPEDVAASVLVGAAQLGLTVHAAADAAYARLLQRTTQLVCAAVGVPRG